MVQTRCEVLRQFLPAHINAAQFFAAVMNEINHLPENCTKGSVTVCVVNACTIGLIPGPALGHCHFIPFTFNRGRDNESTVAQLIVGYKGFLELAFANKFLRDVNPEVVLQGETVRRWHDINGPQIQHELPDNRPEPTRDNVVGAYCTWHTVDGGRGYFWRSKAEIDRVDRGERANTPWKSDYRGMVLKSAIRPASKLWRLTQTMAAAVMLDETAERGEAQLIVDENAAGLLEGGQAESGDDDKRSTLLAVLNHQVGCRSDEDREAVMRHVTGASLKEADASQVAQALEHIMGFERESGMPLNDLLIRARAR